MCAIVLGLVLIHRLPLQLDRPTARPLPCEPLRGGVAPTRAGADSYPLGARFAFVSNIASLHFLTLTRQTSIYVGHDQEASPVRVRYGGSCQLDAEQVSSSDSCRRRYAPVLLSDRDG